MSAHRSLSCRAFLASSLSRASPIRSAQKECEELVEPRIVNSSEGKLRIERQE